MFYILGKRVPGSISITMASSPVIHPTFALAQKEAERLATITPGLEVIIFTAYAAVDDQLRRVITTLIS